MSTRPDWKMCACGHHRGAHFGQRSRGHCTMGVNRCPCQRFEPRTRSADMNVVDVDFVNRRRLA